MTASPYNVTCPVCASPPDVRCRALTSGKWYAADRFHKLRLDAAAAAPPPACSTCECGLAPQEAAGYAKILRTEGATPETLLATCALCSFLGRRPDLTRVPRRPYVAFFRNDENGTPPVAPCDCLGCQIKLSLQ